MEPNRRGPRRKPDTEVVVFDGIPYTRRPGKKYFKAWRYDKVTKKGWADALHRAIWRHHHGPIPDGCDVHHKDDDYNNNVVENLQLLTRSDHAKLHDRFAAINARPDADAVRRRAGQIGWEKAPYKDYVCSECAAPFKSRRTHPPKFCSARCCCNHNRRLRRARVRLGS